MKKFLVSLALAATTLTAAAPAAAQWQGDRNDRQWQDDRGDRGDRGNGRWDRDDRGRGPAIQHSRDLQPRLNRISQQISRGQQVGALTPREGVQLRGQLNNIWQVATNYYRTGGFDWRERNDIERRIVNLEQRVRFERRDDDRRRSY